MTTDPPAAGPVTTAPRPVPPVETTGAGAAGATRPSAPVLGILGGMGPLASAAFLQTVYETALERSRPFTEQALPHCLLDSDPGFPDRTETILARREAEFAELLRQRVDRLLALGATRVVVACMTAHRFVDALAPAPRARLISLVDVVLDELAAAPGDERFLLVSTNGTRAARVFERSARWDGSASRVVLPGPAVQEELHGLLYRLKREPVTDALADRFRTLAAGHGCRGLVAGCTEMHLLTRRLRVRGDGPPVIDPLLTVATRLTTLLAG